MSYPDNFDSKAFDRHWGDATPRDTFEDDLNAAFRRSFEALKADIELICNHAGVDVKPDLEAFEYYKDGVDNAFTIDWSMARDE